MQTWSDDAGASMTLGQWLSLVWDRGWGDTRVWTLLRDACRQALVAVRAALRPGEDEELISDALVIARGVPSSWERAERAGVALVRWLAGVMKRCLLARRRREPATLGDLVDSLPSARLDERAAPTRIDIDPATLLTPKQLAAWRLACEGLSATRAAADLGLSRSAYRDRLRRAKQRLASGTPAPARHRPEETAALACELAREGRSEHATLLVLRSAGATYRTCAATLGTTVDAVRSRVARLWRVWRARRTDRRFDTDRPPSAERGDECAEERSSRAASRARREVGAAGRGVRDEQRARVHVPRAPPDGAAQLDDHSRRRGVP